MALGIEAEKMKPKEKEIKEEKVQRQTNIQAPSRRRKRKEESSVISYQSLVINFMKRKEIGFCILLAVFVCCMATVNILSAKLWTLGGIAINAGIVFYWITFPITDVIGEVYGRKKATFVRARA